jgi:hypothetical protein
MLGGPGYRIFSIRAVLNHLSLLYTGIGSLFNLLVKPLNLLESVSFLFLLFMLILGLCRVFSLILRFLFLALL